LPGYNAAPVSQGSPFADRLNADHFDGRLSEPALSALRALEGHPAQARAFADRACRLMRQANLGAENFTDVLGWVLGTLVPRLLPGAWGGIIPPISASGRHVLINEYLQANSWRPGLPGTRALDVGCGFPPATSVEFAERFPDWTITAADPAIPAAIVYDERGDYASFDAHGTPLYFQAGVFDIGRWDGLLSDPEATRQRFVALREALAARPDSHPGARLVTDPMAAYRRPNLSFLSGGLDAARGRTFDVIRCFNVLIYYDRAYRERFVETAGSLLSPGGVLVCGANWVRTSEAKYGVYRLEDGRMVQKEFAFGVDNIRPLGIIPWYVLHEDEPDTCRLVEILRVLRSDAEFCAAFDAAYDSALIERNLYCRTQDGYLKSSGIVVPPGELERLVVELHDQLLNDGWVERAVRVLRDNGFVAWRNCVGHVAVATS